MSDRHETFRLDNAETKHFPWPKPRFGTRMSAVGHPESDYTPRCGDRSGEFKADRHGWDRARGALTAAIVSSATPEREDSLFPSAISRSGVAGLAIAHGAAGVLFALAVTDSGRYPSFEDWLARRALRPGSGERLGFFDGLHGVAYVLHHLERGEEALDVLDRCRRQRWEQLGAELFSGISGIGASLTYFSARLGDATLLSEALRAADQVIERLHTSRPSITANGHPNAGLLRGSSGAALLCIRLYERTGDVSLLEHAATALRQDLSRFPTSDDGSTSSEARRQVCLAQGSAGVGAVLDEYLKHRWDETFAQASVAIHEDVRSSCPGPVALFHGTSGLITYLSRRYRPGYAGEDSIVAEHVHRLSTPALRYQKLSALPGKRVHELSMDFGTGAAGMLLALGSALHDAPVGLPLLEPGRTGGDESVVAHLDPRHIRTVRDRRC